MHIIFWFNAYLKIKLFSLSYIFFVEAFWDGRRFLFLIIFPQQAQNNLDKNYK